MYLMILESVLYCITYNADLRKIMQLAKLPLAIIVVMTEETTARASSLECVLISVIRKLYTSENTLQE